LGDDGRIACKTCHDPHVAAPDGLLRLASGTAPEQLCLTCHGTLANIRNIGHAETYLRTAGLEAEQCGPCHQVHGGPDAVEAHMLWPKRLSAAAGAAVTGVDRHCAACHRAGGPAPAPAIATHPEAEMFNPAAPGTPAHLPLFNAAGEVDPAGRIACHTCHLTHGRSEPVPLPAGADAVSARELRARVWHIRPFHPANVCTTCHGADALRRFMYFHDATRRGGPIENGRG
jgi:predicted CXXCH cytochrome family protein